MTARTARIAIFGSALLSLFRRIAGRPRRAKPIANLEGLDDHLLEDIGLRRLDHRKPQCLGDYHPKVVAISAFTKDDK